ncbi:hypothetical protein Y032_0023g734 [Ancylostoma ceylanicum]|nr:hypothetical protein Y032_0023g734 [Ancylostoma ceylanicum]
MCMVLPPLPTADAATRDVTAPIQRQGGVAVVTCATTWRPFWDISSTLPESAHPEGSECVNSSDWNMSKKPTQYALAIPYV